MHPSTSPTDRRTPRAVLLVLAGAALAALVSLAAPDRWEPGAGTLRILDGTAAGAEPLLEVPIDIGDTTARTVEAGSFVVRAPGGVPVDAPIRIEIEPGTQPIPRHPRVEIVTFGASAELVPVLERSDTSAIAIRRPPRDAGIVAGLLVVVVLLWVSELVPLHVTSLMIPAVLAATSVTGATEALAPFFDPIIVLFFAGFLMAKAMARVGLDQVIATRLVARAGSSPVRLFATMLALSAGASMWMSNTAAVALLVPIALTITAPLGSPGYQRALVLGIAYASTIGGVGSPIGTPANQLAIRFLGAFADQTITFTRWFGFGLPLVAVMLPIIGVHLWFRLRPDVDVDEFRAAHEAAMAAIARRSRVTAGQVRVLAVLVAVLVGWLTQGSHGTSPGIVGLIGAIALMATGDIHTDDVSTISWPTLLTFGGGLALGLALVGSGTSDHLVSRMTGVVGWPSWAAVALIAAATLLLTTVASNTAAAATLIPLAIPLAALIGVDPIHLVIVVAIASSIDFALVIGTPPTMIAHSTGLFTAREILRVGAVLDVAALVLLLTVVTWFWQLFGLV